MTPKRRCTSVRFLIVWAHTLATHGRPRATQDIDFWVQPTPESAERVCRALADFGFAELAKAQAEFATIDHRCSAARC